MGRAQSPAAQPVTVDNFVRAESDTYLGNLAKESGGLGKFHHRREPARSTKQTVIRLNRDTLYSPAVFDLDAGPVTITLPDAGTRFMSLPVVSQDHYTPTVYGPGRTRSTRIRSAPAMSSSVSARWSIRRPQGRRAGPRIAGCDQGQPEEHGQVRAADWDPASQKKVRDALLVLGSTLPDFKKAFGTKDQVDPIRHLIGSASAWGGNPDLRRDLPSSAARKRRPDRYKLRSKMSRSTRSGRSASTTPKATTRKSVQRLYREQHHWPGRQRRRDHDPVRRLRRQIPNCLPITKGWNYTVRLYRPRESILNGTWKFPEPQPLAKEGSRP